MNNKKKIKNSFDFLRGSEKMRVSIFQLLMPGKLMCPVLFGVQSEIHTTVTYDHKTHFDVNTNNLDDQFGGNQVLKLIPLILAHITPFSLSFYNFSLLTTFKPVFHHLLPLFTV